MRYPAVAAYAALALVFGTAFVAKVSRPARFRGFRDTLAAVPGVPEALATPFAVLVLALEGLVVVGILVPVTRAAAAGLTMVLLTGFAGAVVVLRRQRYTGSCACFGGRSEPVSYVGAVRNLGLVALVAGALLPVAGSTGAVNAIWATMAALVGVFVAIVAIHLEDLAYLLDPKV
jgi:hypothetical protein